MTKSPNQLLPLSSGEADVMADVASLLDHAPLLTLAAGSNGINVSV